MSTEEDLELRDLVTQTLESNGVLSKIRAELRASVFLALEEQDLLQTENSYANKTFKNFIKTTEGMLLTQLVREFLEFFELDFTLSVFDPETSYGKDYEYVGRNTLLKELKMKNVNGSSGPLLAQILKIAGSQNEPDKDSSKEDMDKTITNSDDDDDKIIHKKNVKNSQSNIHFEDSSKISTDQSICVNKVSDTSEKIFTQNNSEDTLHLGATATTTAVATTAAASTEEENGSKPRKEVKEETKKKDSVQSGGFLHEEKPLSSNTSDLMSLKIESNYDEDFQSSASGSAVEGRSGKNSLPGSESEEIEEDIGSGIDDLLSNASGLEDMTVDATVSNASGLGDYMENV
ncbi:FGFR1 oncogene partner [Gryllus bimaculatus]|nr:FGFR1 oncogene partner [Gryllus bimaculatus]